MPSKVTLNQVKNNLIKEVETAAKKNKKIFHTKASMNSFINKIVMMNLSKTHITDDSLSYIATMSNEKHAFPHL